MELVEKFFSSSERTIQYRFDHQDTSIKTIAHLAEDGTVKILSVTITVGCPLTCDFCEMGRSPAQPLSSALVVAQVEEVLKDCNQASIAAIRFDVSGEPLLNWPSLASAIRELSVRYSNPEILVCSAAPASRFYSEVFALGKELSNLSLQFSVHASTQTERQDRFKEDRLLSLTEIGQLGKQWFDATGRRCLFNYAINGLNNGPSEALALSQLFPPEIWVAQITPTYLNNPPQAKGVGQIETFAATLRSLRYEVIIYFPEDALTIGAVPGLS